MKQSNQNLPNPMAKPRSGEMKVTLIKYKKILYDVSYSGVIKASNSTRAIPSFNSASPTVSMRLHMIREHKIR